MDSAPHLKRRLPRALIWLALIVAIWAIAPPFHVRRLATHPSSSNVPAAATRTAFDAHGYAQAFWNERLLPAASHATPLQMLVAALAKDPASAALQYGRRVGLGGKALYFVRGEGRVSSIDRKGIGISIKDQGNVSVVLVTGPIFGNVLRDATGLLDLGNFSSFDFNSLSTELNRLAESTAQPRLQQVTTGARLQFLGCADTDSTGGKLLMRIVPVSVDNAP